MSERFDNIKPERFDTEKNTFEQGTAEWHLKNLINSAVSTANSFAADAMRIQLKVDALHADAKRLQIALDKLTAK